MGDDDYIEGVSGESLMGIVLTRLAMYRLKELYGLESQADLEPESLDIIKDKYDIKFSLPEHYISDTLSEEEIKKKATEQFKNITINGYMLFILGDQRIQLFGVGKDEVIDFF